MAGDFYKNMHTKKNNLKFNTKIFVLSSSINPDDKAKAEENAHVDQYIYKPLTTSSLQALQLN